MISRILVIASGGLIAYAKSFVGETIDQYLNEISESDLIGGFISAISNFAMEIKGGRVNSLNFKHFNIIFTSDEELDIMFVLICDIDDIEEEVREKAELLKTEFLKRYKENIIKWTGEISIFQGIDQYVEENIFIPPKILLVGENGVGKSTIMDLFPGEVVIQLDDDLNEIIQKPINVSGLDLKQFILREININDLIDNSKHYRTLLNSVDVICLVTNSAASNLGRTKKLYEILKQKVKRADFYIIANFQNVKEQAFDPLKIEESYGVKTYGFSATSSKAKKEIFKITVEILKTSILEKIKSSQREVTQDNQI
ncbi:MAG: hypothetical protein ACFFBP_09235 [Promethearchaeota archaeon]